MDKILIILLIFLTSCANFTRQMEEAALRSNLYSIRNGVYLHDKRTGLCYFVVDGWRGCSVTAVNCDSLKKVDVKSIYILRK